MPIVKNLTKQEIEKIQIDEGVCILDYGKTNERPLLPCRGGGEFSATATIRDIEFDGRVGKTAGMQTIDEQAATLKVTVINMSQRNLALAMPFCRMYDSTGTEITSSLAADPATIKNPKMGIIPDSAYLDNITMFAKLIDGTYKKITIHNPMHEGGLTATATQKAEGELALEFNAHYTTDELDGDLWEVTEVSSFEMRKAASGGGTT
jgi:hypothetical protein